MRYLVQKHRSSSRQSRKRNRRHQFFRPLLEQLEDRRMLATVNWISDSDGFWDEAANWEDDQGVNRVPGFNDDVIVDRPNGQFTVTIRDASQQRVNSLTSAENITISSGGLEVRAPSEMSGALQLAGGNFEANGSSVTITLAGATTWNGGSVTGSGTVVVTGTMTLDSPNDLPLTATLTNQGTILHEGSGNLALTKTLTNESGATYEFRSDADITDGTFINAGTVRKSGGSGESRFGLTPGSALFQHLGGTVEVQTGQLTLNRSFSTTTSTGAHFQVSNGAVLDLTGGHTATLTGTYTASGAGRVELASGSISTASDGATLDFDAGVFHWTGGTISSTSSRPVTNLDTITLSGDGERTLSGNLINLGTVVLTDAGTLAGGIFDNRAGAVWDFQGDADVIDGTFINAGTVRKSGGSGESQFGLTPGSALFQHLGGTVDVQSGKLTLNRSFSTTTSTGAHFQVSDGAVLDLTSGHTATLTGTYTASGGGRVELATGSIATANDGAVFDFDPGVFHWVGGTISSTSSRPVTNLDTMTLSGDGVRNLGGNLINLGTVVLTDGGTLSGGTFDNREGAVWDFQGDADVIGGTFINAGTVRKSAGTSETTAFTSGDFNNDGGTVDVQVGRLKFQGTGNSTGGIFNVSAGAVLELATSNQFTIGGNYTGSGAGRIEFTGRLTGNSANPPHLSFPEGMFHWVGTSPGNSSGTIVNDAFITLSGDESQQLRGHLVNNGTVIQESDSSFFLAQGSIIDNFGLWEVRGDGDFELFSFFDPASGLRVGADFHNFGTFRKTEGLGESLMFSTDRRSDARLNNLGTIEVLSGRLTIDTDIVQLDEDLSTDTATLTGGRWSVNSFSTLQFINFFDEMPPIITSFANVTLDGPASAFPNIDSLEANGGTFEILNGRDFATVGDLVNGIEQLDRRVEVVNTLLPNVFGFARDRLTGNLFAHQDRSGEIAEFTPAGVEVAPRIPAPGAPSSILGMDFTETSLNIGGSIVPAETLLASNRTEDPPRVFALNKNTGEVLASVALEVPTGITGVAHHAARGTLFVSHFGSEMIFEVNPSDGTLINSFSVIPPGAPTFRDESPNEVDVDPVTGNLLFVSNDLRVGVQAKENGIVRVLTPEGDFVEDIDLSGFGINTLTGLDVDNDTGDLWLSSTHGRRAWKVFDFGRQTLGQITIGPSSTLTVAGDYSGGQRLVSFWKGENDAIDSFGGHNGTLRNNTTFAAGQFGQAFSFDGDQDWVELPFSSPPLANFTISAWVQRGDLSTAGLVLGDSISQFFGVEADGSLFLEFFGAPRVDSGGLAIVDDQFHHIAVTKDGGAVKFYLDGNESTPVSLITSQDFQALTIGGQFFNSVGDFTGLIDELAVFNDALTSDEILELFTNNNPENIGAIPSNLSIEIGGRPASGQFGKLDVTGTADFSAGRLNIELVDGFGPTLGDEYAIVTFASRSGTFDAVNGADPFFAVVIDDTSVTLDTLVSATDLDVREVLVPANAAPGETISIEYTVDNLSDDSVVGDWTDSVYLSADESFDPNDPLIGRIEHTGGITAHGFYTHNLTAPLPGVIDGEYYVIVIADSRGRIVDTNLNNNIGVSMKQITVDLPFLTFDTLTTGVIDQGQDVYFRLDVPVGGDVLVSGAFAESFQAEFFIGQGQLPTRSQFDFVASNPAALDRSITLASPQAGDYYILLHGREGAASGAGFDLLAQHIQFALQSVSPGRGSNLGQATTTLVGTGFSEDTVVELLDSQGATVATATTQVVNPNKLFATFDLTGVNEGVYDLRASDDGQQETIDNGYEVLVGARGEVRVELVVPGAVRSFRAYSGFIDYQNIGDSDAIPPLIFLDSTIPLAFDRMLPGEVTEQRFLAISKEGPAGILPPGASVRVPFRFRGTGQIAVRSMSPDATEPMGWETFRNEIRSEVTADDWDDAFDEVFIASGDTVGDYVRLLGEAATLYQHRTGETTSDPGDLHGFLMLEQLLDRNTSIRGNVFRDSPNNPANDVSVTAVNQDTGEARGTFSRADGLVRFVDLEPGTYDIFFDDVIPPEDLQPVEVTGAGLPPDQTWLVGTGGSIKGRLGVPFGVTLIDEENAILATVQAVDEQGNVFTAGVDEDGVYTLLGLPDGFYDLSFRTAETVPVFVNGIEAIEGQTTGLIDLFSPLGGSISGTVLDADTNQPVPDVVVSVREDEGNPRTTFTDVNGNYTLTGVNPGLVTIAVTSEGLFSKPLIDIPLAAGQEVTGADLIADFSFLGSVSGTVTSDGQPVQGAGVDILDGETVIRSAVTDAAGFYLLKDINADDYDVQVDAFGFALATVPVTVAINESVDQDFALDTAATIHGTVTNLAVDDVPFETPGLQLAILDPNGDVFFHQTDSSGVFGVSRLGLGAHTLMLADGSHRQPFTINTGDDNLDLSFQIDTGVILGRLVDSDGVAPLSDVTVSLVLAGQTQETVPTRANGEFVFGFVSPGTYELHFSSADRFFEPLTNVMLDDLLIDLGNVTTESASLDLDVTDALTNTNITSGGVVTFIQRDALGLTTHSFEIDATGMIQIDTLAPGSYTLQAVFDGFAFSQTQLDVVEGANVFEFGLTEGGSITGTITDNGALPFEGARITAFDPAQPLLQWHGITDENGQYLLSVPAGTYDVFITDLRNDPAVTHLAHQQFNGVVVGEGQDVQQDAQLITGDAAVNGQINAVVPDGFSTSPFGGTLTLLDASVPVAQTSADADGVFTFEGIAAGDYDLQVQSPGYAYPLLPVTIATGVNDNVDPSGVWTNPSISGPADLEATENGGPGLFIFAPPPLSLAIGAGPLVPPAELRLSLGQLQSLAGTAVTKLRDFLADILGEPDPIHDRFSSRGMIPADCPEAFAAFRNVLRWQRAADNYFDAWRMRWEGAQQVAWANIGLFGVNLGKFASGLLLGAPKAFSSSKLDDLFEARKAIPVNVNNFDEFIESFDKFDEINRQIAKAAATFQDLLGDVDRLVSAHGLLGSSISTVTGGLPDVGEVFDAFANIPSWTSFNDFLGFINVVGNFGGGVLQIADTIGAALAALNALPGAQAFIGAAGPIGDFLQTVAAAAQGVADGINDIQDLDSFEQQYLNAVANLNRAFRDFADAFRECDDDDQEDNKEPDKPLTDEDIRNIFAVLSSDPNDIVGPDGSGRPDHFMRPEQTLPYIILFENKPEATAPAQEVVITHQLDVDLDFTTFELGDFGFGDFVFDVPEGRDFFQTRVDMSDTLGFFVDFEAGIDLNTGLATWTFTSIDPLTGDLVSDALAGFLPPNVTSPVGEGFVEFSVRPRVGTGDGDTIDAQATIVFDTNAPLDTPVYVNKLDDQTPTSSINPLPMEINLESFTVSWTGDDGLGSGIQHYDVFVSSDGGPFEHLLFETTETSVIFSGEFGHAYAFYSIATDNVGHRELTPTSADTMTTLVQLPDDDQDGASNDLEDQGPNNGDANNDGTPDRDQAHVASLAAQTPRQERTIITNGDGRAFRHVATPGNPSATDSPPDTTFPIGFFQFELHDVDPGGAARVSISLPAGYAVDTYWRFGPTPDDASDHWYEFVFDGTVGAEILDDQVVLHFVDGQLGDDDLAANGVIVDAGGPANSYPWQNFLNRYDVSGDGAVAPVDVLQVVNDLNRSGPRLLTRPAGAARQAPFLDVNGDRSVSPVDALQIVNLLNRPARGVGEGPSEVVSPAAGAESPDEAARARNVVFARELGDAARLPQDMRLSGNDQFPINELRQHKTDDRFYQHGGLPLVNQGEREFLSTWHDAAVWEDEELTNELEALLGDLLENQLRS